MTQTHSKKFHCIYLLQYYPFDTQICKVDLQVEEFDKRNVELIPGNMDLLTDTELTQYYIKTWSLDYNDPSTICINFGKKIINCFRITYTWFENGDSIQAPPHQWDPDYISAIISSSPYVICHNIFQANIFWGICDSQFVYLVGNHHIIYKASHINWQS